MSITIIGGASAAKEIKLKVGDASLGETTSEGVTSTSVPRQTKSKDEHSQILEILNQNSNPALLGVDPWID